jgi:hypothetical protein
VNLGHFHLKQEKSCQDIILKENSSRNIFSIPVKPDSIGRNFNLALA